MSFLTVTRKLHEEIVIHCPNGDILKVILIKHKGARQSVIGIEAPITYKVNRAEVDHLYPKVCAELETTK